MTRTNNPELILSRLRVVSHDAETGKRRVLRRETLYPEQTHGLPVNLGDLMRMIHPTNDVTLVSVRAVIPNGETAAFGRTVRIVVLTRVVVPVQTLASRYRLTKTRCSMILLQRHLVDRLSDIVPVVTAATNANKNGKVLVQLCRRLWTSLALSPKSETSFQVSTGRSTQPPETHG